MAGVCKGHRVKGCGGTGHFTMILIYRYMCISLSMYTYTVGMEENLHLKLSKSEV